MCRSIIILSISCVFVFYGSASSVAAGQGHNTNKQPIAAVYKRTGVASTTATRLARDSYVKAASASAAEHSNSFKSVTDLPGSSSSFYYPPDSNSKNHNHAYYYQLYPDTAKHYGNAYSYSNQQNNNPHMDPPSYPDWYEMNEIQQHEADSKTDPASIFALAFNSISSLSWITTAILAIVLAPVLIPLVISPLIFLGIVLYFIPVIKLDLNPENADDSRSKKTKSIRRAKNALQSLEATGRFFKAVTADEECIERIVCEIGRMTRGNPLENWISLKLERFNNSLVQRISRSYQIAQRESNCRMLSCDPVRQFRKIVSSVKGSTSVN